MHRRYAAGFSPICALKSGTSNIDGTLLRVTAITAATMALHESIGQDKETGFGLAPRQYNFAY
jgi:hypothetical protein